MHHLVYDTHTGPRPNLEDAVQGFVITPLRNDGQPVCVGILLDGVGGEHYGEVASGIGAYQIAVEIIDRLFAEPAAFDANRALAALVDAIASANQTIIDQARDYPRLAGMATTVVAFIAHDTKLHVAWLGDSRCYLQRDETITRITRDHSQVQDLIDAGIVRESEALWHPDAHIITRYLGRTPMSRIDQCTINIRPDDIVILTSDGLTDVLADVRINELIIQHRSNVRRFQALPPRLVQEALAANTHDNVTVLACHLGGAAQPIAASPTITGGYGAAVLANCFTQLKENDDDNAKESLRTPAWRM